MDYSVIIFIYKKCEGQRISTVIFLFIQSQTFYKNIQTQVVDLIDFKSTAWADIGCSVGLLTRIAYKKNHSIIGYDLNKISLKIASLLNKKITYKNEDFLNFTNNKFDVISATSLLSVLDNKENGFEKLLMLLKNQKSILIIIEPTNKFTIKNVKALCEGSIKRYWYYKAFFLWARARENKAIDINIINKHKNLNIEHTYLYNDMIRISKISKQ